MALKLIPLLFAWLLMVTANVRFAAGKAYAASFAAAAGFGGGVIGGSLLLNMLRGEAPFNVLKLVTGGAFLLFWGYSVALLYRVSGAGKVLITTESPENALASWPRPAVAAVTLGTGVLAGAICICRVAPLEGGGPSFLVAAAVAWAGVVLVPAALAAEKRIPAPVVVTKEGLITLLLSLVLFISAAIPRLDLFAPLSMKVMKFIHDFVHQFSESMLFPDHPFFRADVWEYIGLLFSREVGFWGGLIIWFLPVLLVLLALGRVPLPSVSHIRQGAARRRVLATAVRRRRQGMIVPGIALLVMVASLLQSRFPDIEYWDPKPIAVSADSEGTLVIQKKGEVDLEDGKIHKFIVHQGGREARFFILMTPSGHLAVTLDACAICKPEGYGQAEGSVICYYCMTLIPLETVGKPGGCNPVPVQFSIREDAVAINATAILNAWSETVQATTRVKGEGR